MADKNNKTVKVIANLSVASDGESREVLTFDKAWHEGLRLARPVNIQFIGFARSEK